MKVWKSPVLYLGMLLLGAVIAALLAPYVVDWNAYRPRLEAYGEKLTGRKVKINGAVAVKLFPWPSLTIDDVHLANPPEIPGQEFARAARVEARLQLAGLASGNFQVESIAIEHPVVALMRLADGRGNWRLQPSAEVTAHDLLGRVKLDKISLSDAEVNFSDGRGGSVKFTIPRGLLASPAIEGPWRMQADDMSAGQYSFDLNLTTGAFDAGKPFRFGINLRPASAADGQALGYAVSFDGALDQGSTTGVLRIAPAVDAAGKGDAEGELRPFDVTAKVTADFDHASLENIEFSPLDPKDGGTAMTGDAIVTFGSKVTARANFNAAKLDLGEWAGAEARAMVREGGALALADALLGKLSPAADIAASVKVTALLAGRELYENVNLKVEASRDAIRVRELSGSLPGRSRALFDGVFFPGKTGAELAGNLAVESGDMRQLAYWIFPEAQPSLGSLWTGSRGRLKLQTEVSLTANRFRLSNLRYEVDSVPGKAELIVAKGGRGSVDLRIDADRLDIDNFLAKGISAISGGDGASLYAGLGLLVPQEDAPDLRLTVQADNLLLNGVEAEDVVIDLAAGATGLDLRTLEIGNVGGARLEASGLILDAGQGADGSIGMEIAAENPAGLLRLFGLAPAKGSAPWFASLGKTAFKGRLAVKTGKGGPALEIEADGSSGPFNLTAAGTATGGFDRKHMALSGTADLRSTTSAALVGLLGLTPAAGGDESGRLAITAAGTLAEGFVTDFQLQAFGARFSFNGTALRDGDPWNAAGKVTLRGTDLAALAAAAGYPAGELPKAVVAADGEINGASGKVTLSALRGRIGDTTLGGNLTLAAGGVITGDVETGPIVLPALAQALFLAWNGTSPDLETPFANGLPLGLTGEVWIRPKELRVRDGFAAGNAQIGITASAEAIRFAAFGKDVTGRNLAAEISSGGEGDTRSIAGKITLPIDLANQLRLAGGETIADGKGVLDLRFSGSGRTPGGALADLSGSGSYTIDDLQLRGISPGDFTAALAEIKDASGLTRAFDRLRGGAGLSLGRTSGTITIVNGVAGFLPVKWTGQEADISIKTIADLAEGAIDIAVGIDFKTPPGLPAMEVAYGGPPLMLARSEDKTALSSKLSMGLMQQGVAELERLQREQEQAIAEEERQRLEDEEKLQAYYSQRDELLLRKRELNVHGALRLAEAERLRLAIENERALNAEINRAELKQRQRELRVLRRLAKLAEAAPSDGIDVMDLAPPAPGKPPAARVVVKPKPPEGPPILPPPEPPSQ